MCCWFYGKVGHKKVECFAREKSKNMAKKVNKAFTKPKKLEEVLLAKKGQEASSLELGHGVFYNTKGKEIERALGVDEEGLMVKEMRHEGSQVLNRSVSKGNSTGASEFDAVLMEKQTSVFVRLDI
ncbi:hypothetical protein Bca101_010794 [Brassica carinata]